MITKSHVAALFKVLISVQGHRFASQFKGLEMSDVIAVWVDALNSAAMTPAKLQRGIDRVYQLPHDAFGPSIPEFLELCKTRASDLGIPDCSAAYNAICKLDLHCDFLRHCHTELKKLGLWREHEFQVVYYRAFVRLENNEKLEFDQNLTKIEKKTEDECKIWSRRFSDMINMLKNGRKHGFSEIK